MVFRAANLIVRAIRLAPIVTCTLVFCMGVAEPAHAQGAGKSTPAASGAAAAATPAGTPASEGGEATGADTACQKAVAGLGSGDLSGFKALPSQTRASLAQNQRAADLFTCLAVAEGSTSYCDALAKPAKDACVEQSKLIGELKGVPKEGLKAQILYNTCLREVPREIPKQDCDKVREAIKTRNAAACAGLSKAEGAWGRDGLCPALATGDAAKCNTAPEPAMRDTCAALATDDPGRCPKGATDCTNLVRNFAAIEKGGLDGDIDPTTAALRKGKKACAPLAAGLETVCSASDAPKKP